MSGCERRGVSGWVWMWVCVGVGMCGEYVCVSMWGCMCGGGCWGNFLWGVCGCV